MVDIMEKLKNTSKVYLILFYIGIFLLNSFYPREFLTILMGISVIIIFFIAFPDTGSFNRYVSLLLILIGSVILINNNGTLTDYKLGLIKNGGLISLLFSVPLLGIAFYYDDYQGFVLDLTERYMNSNYSFYYMTVLIINILGMLLNLASMPIVYQLLTNTSQNYSKDLFYKALTRGFTANILWSPNFISVAVVIQYLEIPWQKMAAVGLLLAVVANIVGIILERIINKPQYRTEKFTDFSNGQKGKNVLKLIALLFLLIVFIITLESLTGKSILVVLPLVAFVFPLVLAVILTKIDIFIARFREFFNNLANKGEEFILFSAIGYFGYALSISNIDKYITVVINELGFNNEFILLPFIVLVITILSLIGVHPIIGISTIAVALPVSQLPLTVAQMAAAFLLSYSLYHLLSPFSAVSLVMTDMTGESPFNANIKLNIIYAALYTFFAIFLLTVVI